MSILKRATHTIIVTEQVYHDFQLFYKYDYTGVEELNQMFNKSLSIHDKRY
jgi:hypothetical protein